MIGQPQHLNCGFATIYIWKIMNVYKHNYIWEKEDNIL